MSARRQARIVGRRPVFQAVIDGNVVASATSPSELRDRVNALPADQRQALSHRPIQYERPSGERVKAMINAAGLSIRDTARALDMNPKKLQSWIRNGDMPWGVWVALNALGGSGSTG